MVSPFLIWPLGTLRFGPRGSGGTCERPQVPLDSIFGGPDQIEGEYTPEAGVSVERKHQPLLYPLIHYIPSASH